MNIFIISYVQEAIPPFCIYLIQIWDANLRAELDLPAREDSHSVAEHLTLRAKDSHWTWSYLLYELGTIYFGNGARTWGLYVQTKEAAIKWLPQTVDKVSFYFVYSSFKVCSHEIGVCPAWLENACQTRREVERRPE